MARVLKYVLVRGSHLFWIRRQFPITAIREIKILKKLHHQNVINLKEIVTSPGLTNITWIRALFWQTAFVQRRLRLVLIVSGPERDEQGKPSMILSKNTIESFALLLILMCYMLWCWVVEGNKYKGSIYMVFEYMDHDLTGLSDRPGMRFTIPQIKVKNHPYMCVVVLGCQKVLFMK